MEGIFELRWFRIRLFSKKFPEKEDEKEKKKKAKKKGTEKEKRKWEWDDVKNLLKLGFESLGPILRFFEDIFRSINLETFKFHIILGLNSPVDTAKTLGYLWAAVSLVNVHPKVHISAEPSFNQERVDGDLILKLTIRLINPLIAVIRLLINKSILKLLWELRRFRK